MKNLLLALGFAVATSFTATAQFWEHTEPVLLEGTSNTVEAEESIPVFSNDSSTLYFVRSNSSENKGGVNDYDIYFSRKNEEGKYTDSKNLKSLNNKFNNTVVGVSKDGQSIYLLDAYDGKKDLVKGIAVAKKSGSGWSNPKRIDIPSLDIDGEFYGFHVSENEKTIIISYQGDKSIGEEDLYVSTKTGSSWSAPMHMGSTINSTGFEISPFLSKNQDTLFFSSNGFGGEGDADIFYAVKNGSWSDWSAPVNLGDVINSPKFDAYFSHNGSQAYWSSNRDGELSDIYRIDFLAPEPVILSCESTNASEFGATDGQLDVTVSSGQAPFSYEWSNGATTEDLADLGAGEYTLNVTDSKGQNATVSCVITQPAEIVPAYANLDFKHNFGYNKVKLSTSTGDLKEFVDKVEQQIIDGRKEITIQVTSSASRVPTKTFGTNEKLASARADYIKKMLEKRFAKLPPVSVEVVSSSVNGPAYEDDSANKDKYVPYQYIQLKTK